MKLLPFLHVAASAGHVPSHVPDKFITWRMKSGASWWMNKQQTLVSAKSLELHLLLRLPIVCFSQRLLSSVAIVTGSWSGIERLGAFSSSRKRSRCLMWPDTIRVCETKPMLTLKTWYEKPAGSTAYMTHHNDLQQGHPFNGPEPQRVLHRWRWYWPLRMRVRWRAHVCDRW